MFSNVYRGEIDEPDRLPGDPKKIAVKKTFIKGDVKKQPMMESRILKVLHRYRHKNVMQLLYTFTNEHDEVACIGLIFEYMPSTLHNYIRNWPKLIENRPDMVEVKLLCWQIFRGLRHLADNNVIHRDLKPQNILVNPENGLLKIGDFGSSKIYRPGEPNHPYHVTRYYRAPELLLRAALYGPEIDLWSTGCILGEMLKGRVLLPGSSTVNQFHQIVAVLGKPTLEDCEAMRTKDPAELNEASTQKYCEMAPKTAVEGFRRLLPKVPSEACDILAQIMTYKPKNREACDILAQIMTYKPKNRLGGQAALGHKFFAQLFEDGVRRFNGKPITVVTKTDLESALKHEIEDHSHTADSSEEHA
uniref:Protein kinase domain-containing protein n=1 Tax=Panagrolaimus sp. JU765 TaxID=591449 RepID=A0AC34R4L0_9BILA